MSVYQLRLPVTGPKPDEYYRHSILFESEECPSREQVTKYVKEKIEEYSSVGEGSLPWMKTLWEDCLVAINNTKVWPTLSGQITEFRAENTHLGPSSPLESGALVMEKRTDIITNKQEQNTKTGVLDIYMQGIKADAAAYDLVLHYPDATRSDEELVADTDQYLALARKGIRIAIHTCRDLYMHRMRVTVAEDPSMSPLCGIYMRDRKTNSPRRFSPTIEDEQNLMNAYGCFVIKEELRITSARMKMYKEERKKKHPPAEKEE